MLSRLVDENAEHDDLCEEDCDKQEDGQRRLMDQHYVGYYQGYQQYGDSSHADAADEELHLSDIGDLNWHVDPAGIIGRHHHSDAYHCGDDACDENGRYGRAVCIRLARRVEMGGHNRRCTIEHPSNDSPDDDSYDGKGYL